MKANDPKALEALARYGRGLAVIYLNFTPYGLTHAGGIDGRPFYMVGSVSHWLDPDLEATITDVAIAYRTANGELVNYVTALEEAPDADLFTARDIIDTRAAILATGQWDSLQHWAEFSLGNTRYVAPPAT